MSVTAGNWLGFWYGRSPWLVHQSLNTATRLLLRNCSQLSLVKSPLDFLLRDSTHGVCRGEHEAREQSTVVAKIQYFVQFRVLIHYTNKSLPYWSYVPSLKVDLVPLMQSLEDLLLVMRIETDGPGWASM